MKVITKSENRRLSYSVEEGMILIKEEDRYTRPGYMKSTWDRMIISTTREELEKILDETK